MDFIVTIKQQIDNLLEKLLSLKEISSKSFNGDEKVVKKIEVLKIDIALFDRFKSDKSEKIINSLNSSLDNVLKKIRDLQGEINKQKKEIQELIKKHQININNFLKNAGYRYQVILTKENENYKLRLQRIESQEKIQRGDQYLSFGEKNAFALVLFMYDSLSKKLRSNNFRRSYFFF